MPSTEEPQRGRVDEDDHDLLTFGEAGERLKTEITEAKRALAGLEDCGDEAARVRANARLEALQDAAQRNSARPINDENFEKFFGYAGKAKRNLSGAPGSE